jgi:hypothetical protein
METAMSTLSNASILGLVTGSLLALAGAPALAATPLPKPTLVAIPPAIKMPVLPKPVAVASAPKLAPAAMRPAKPVSMTPPKVGTVQIAGVKPAPQPVAKPVAAPAPQAASKPVAPKPAPAPQPSAKPVTFTPVLYPVFKDQYSAVKGYYKDGKLVMGTAGCGAAMASWVPGSSSLYPLGSGPKGSQTVSAVSCYKSG